MLPGLAATVVGLLLMARLGEHTTYFPGMFVALLILGLGAGMAFIPLLAIAMEHVPSADAGLASGIVNVSLQMSGAIGLAVLGTISTDHARSLLADGHSLPSALTSGYQLAFLVGAGCVALGAAVALVTLRDAGATSIAPVPAAGGRLAFQRAGSGGETPAAIAEEETNDGRAADARTLELARAACPTGSSPASCRPRARTTRATRSSPTTARSGTWTRSRSRPTRPTSSSTRATGCSAACR